MTDPTVPPLQRLCAEVIALRERNDRQHKLYEQTLGQTRDDLRAAFGQFAADAQRAYQQFRDELTGEKRNALALLSQLVDVATDLDRLAAQRPALDGAPPEVAGWAEGVAVAARKAQAMLAQLVGGGVGVEAAGVGGEALLRVAQDFAGPVDVAQRRARLALPRPQDALRPAGLDDFGVGVLGHAEDQERPGPLARQVGQLDAGFVRHDITLRTLPPPTSPSAAP